MHTVYDDGSRKRRRTWARVMTGVGLGLIGLVAAHGALRHVLPDVVKDRFAPMEGARDWLLFAGFVCLASALPAARRAETLARRAELETVSERAAVDAAKIAYATGTGQVAAAVAAILDEDTELAATGTDVGRVPLEEADTVPLPQVPDVAIEPTFDPSRVAYLADRRGRRGE